LTDSVIPIKIVNMKAKLLPRLRKKMKFKLNESTGTFVVEVEVSPYKGGRFQFTWRSPDPYKGHLMLWIPNELELPASIESFCKEWKAVLTEEELTPYNPLGIVFDI
jgi:hypothetical protein